MTLKEIKLLECGSWFGKSWQDEKIPELGEVFSLLHKKKDIFIEVKTNEVIVPYLLDSINKDKVSSDQITIISFYPKVIQEVKRTDPKIKCNLLIAFDHKEIEINEIIDLTLSVDANGVGAQNHKRLNEEFIQSLRSNNKTVHVWTVNSKKEAAEYSKLGINTITTNKPLYLRKHLEQLKLS